MANTYTSDWFSVSDGDTTTHSPQSLVSTDSDINILSSQVRWEGVNSSYTTTSYSTSTNSGSATAYTTSSTNTATNTDNQGDAITATTQIPDVPSGYSFDRVEVVTSAQYVNENGNGTSLFWEDIYGNNDSTTIGSDYDHTVIDQTKYDESLVGDKVTITFSSVPDGTVFNYVQATSVTYGTDTSYSTQSDTTYVSYPSVPNGYSFDRHYWREEEDGSYVDSDYVYSNKVGNSRSVTSDYTYNTRTLEMETRGSKTNTHTRNTNDPSITGDVSGDSSGVTLYDGETSNWYSLSGLDSSTQDFSHNISGSNEAKFRFRFDWEYALPDSIATKEIATGTGVYPVTLADPSDQALDYNFYQVQVDGHGILAYDVVDPSDPDAIDFYIYHPTHGELALREQT